MLQARWGDHGSLTLSPPGSSGPGHRILLVTKTRCPPVPRLRTHGDGCAPGTTGGDPRSLTACRHRWRRRTSWVPHSHGLGRWWQVEESLGALSASLPWDLPGKVPRCGTAAPLVLGARRAHHRTGPSKGRGGGGRGRQVAVWPLGGPPQLHWSARGCAGLGVCDEVGGARAHLEVPWAGRSRDAHSGQAVSLSQPPLFKLSGRRLLAPLPSGAQAGGGGGGLSGGWVYLSVHWLMVLTCLGEEDHLLGYHAGPRSQHTRRSASAPFP